ncbi:MAG: nucleoside-triphosphatase [bacterium]
MKHILITGRPKVGKTTLLKKIIPYLKDAGGFYTEDVCEKDNRVGFAIVTLNGKRLKHKSAFGGLNIKWKQKMCQPYQKENLNIEYLSLSQISLLPPAGVFIISLLSFLVATIKAMKP